MRYEITENLEVKIYANDEDVPFWYQPDYPNGDKFDNGIEAENWAKLAVASMQDDQPFPPNGKGLAPEKKPDPNTKADLLKRLGITADEAKLLLS